MLLQLLLDTKAIRCDSSMKLNLLAIPILDYIFFTQSKIYFVFNTFEKP